MILRNIKHIVTLLACLQKQKKIQTTPGMRTVNLSRLIVILIKNEPVTY